MTSRHKLPPNSLAPFWTANFKAKFVYEFKIFPKGYSKQFCKIHTKTAQNSEMILI